MMTASGMYIRASEFDLDQIHNSLSNNMALVIARKSLRRNPKKQNLIRIKSANDSG
jgi:hypothetical protein